MARFEDVLDNLCQQEMLGQLRALFPNKELLVVRDVAGKCRIYANVTRAEIGDDEARIDRIEDELRSALGAFAGSPLITFLDELLFPGELFGRSHSILKRDRGFTIRIFERGVMGEEWDICKTVEHRDKPKRVVFWGFKGGVGRSTALIAAACHLARAKGKNVLVFDFDLESPGISSTLLGPKDLPKYGVVDWFVEDAAGQADDRLVGDMLMRSALGGDGWVKVVPAHGCNFENYLSKLNRCYLATSLDESWAERMNRMVGQVEEIEKPDIVFIDSRAGLQDIAASAVTSLGAHTLLFAVDSRQTWEGYRLLFSYWHRKMQEDMELYDSLTRNLFPFMKVVAGLVPETEVEGYLTSFREHSYNLFSDNLYQETTDEPDVFNFDVGDEDAPHYPLLVNWTRRLQEFDPLQSPDFLHEPLVRVAFEDFFTKFEEWLEK